MPKNICIISHQHLSRNPRLLKESLALEKVGLNVTILTSVYSALLLAEDLKLLKSSRISLVYYNNLIFKNGASFKTRLINKIGRWLNKSGIENKYAFGYAPDKCLQSALKQDADLYICHQELPIYIGTRLLKLGKRVAFDFEDFYSEDLLEKDRRYRPQRKLETAEKYALNYGNLCYTTSDVLAEGLITKYNLDKKPKVIFNSFETYLSKTVSEFSAIQLIWISQTIGPGRGLETFISALNLANVHSFVLNLRGNISVEYQSELQNLLINPKHALRFLPLIPNEAIQQDLTNYHLGVATEDVMPLNKDLTLSNKIFHYLSVGLPVIATKTKGQLSLKDDFDNCIRYYANPEELTSILNEIDLAELNACTSKINQVYAKSYDWVLQEKKLQQMILKLL